MSDLTVLVRTSHFGGNTSCHSSNKAMYSAFSDSQHSALQDIVWVWVRV